MKDIIDLCDRDRDDNGIENELGTDYPNSRHKTQQQQRKLHRT